MSPASTATPGSDPLLERLGQRVRDRRARRGWSRQELADASGLSLRFLARIESGDGNISILRLQSLARALGTTADALIQAGTDRPRLIALVGMRGAGKSTVGPILAEQLDRPFIEMDAMITEASGLTLDQVFELHGEEYYRRLERDAVRRLLTDGGSAVVAAAGGIVNDPTSWALLLGEATVVWLKARPEDHWNRVIAQGDRRPMADNPEALEQLRGLLTARERTYQAAHLTIDTAGRTIRSVVAELAAHLDEELPAERKGG